MILQNSIFFYKFIYTFFIFQSKIELVHDAVSGNSLPELQNLLNEDGGKRKLASCKDQAGVGLLHKAVYYDLPEIVHYLVDNYTYLINQKDKVTISQLSLKHSYNDHLLMSS